MRSQHRQSGIGGRIPVDTPILLAPVRGSTVFLPQVVEGAVVDEVAREAALQRANGILMLALPGNGLIIIAPLRRPPRLRHHHRLPPGCITDVLRPFLDKRPSTGGQHVAVEESVAVDSAEIRGLAEARVVLHGSHGVDGDDGTAISCALELRSRGPDRTRDLAYRCGAGVHQFVPDTDGVDDRPIPVQRRFHGGDGVRDAVDIEDPEEQLDVLALDGGEDVGDLVAVDAVKADEIVALDDGKVLRDLRGGFAGVVGVVGGVGYAVAEAGAGGGRAAVGATSAIAVAAAAGGGAWGGGGGLLGW